MSFDNALDGESIATPFANSLTATNNDFANYQHRDNDLIAAAYGMWWTTAVEKGENGQPRYKFKDDIDHNQVRGGAFLWGAYGIAVDFERYVLLCTYD